MSNFNDNIDSAFKQKPDMATILVRAIDRKNMAGTYDYPSGIGVVLNNLPQRWANWVRAQDEMWTEEIPHLIFKTINGVDLGYKNDPLVWNEEHTELGLSSDLGFGVMRLLGKIDWEDTNIREVKNVGTEEEPVYELVLYDENIPVKRYIGDIDWDDPRIYSPYKKIITRQNYELKDALVHAAAEHAALTWTQDPLEQDAGDTEEYIVERRYTPFRPPVQNTEG